MTLLGFSIVVAPTPTSAAEATIYISADAPEDNLQWITTWNSMSVEGKAKNLLSRFIPRDLVGRSFLVEGTKSEVIELIQSLSLPSGTTVRVEVDIKMTTLNFVPNDTYFSVQWDMADSNTAQFGIGLPTARELFNNVSGYPASVAVLDTGITSHVDLTQNAEWKGVNGWDFYSGDADPTDTGDYCNTGSGITNSSWHGTHVTGTIAADTDNGIGVAGIAPMSKVIHARVLGTCGGSLTDVADAIRWAAGLPVPVGSATPTPLITPARVINLSLGGTGACVSYMQSAVTAARAAGAILVVAAGNSNIDAASATPANCAGVFTVASVGQSGKRAYYSNYGTNVSIAAQGGDFSDTTPFAQGGILSTLNAGQYTTGAGNVLAYYQGTSMAAPHVAGVAALLLTAKPNLTVTELENLLKNSALPFPADARANSCAISGKCGTGILNAVTALNLLAENNNSTIPNMLASSATTASISVALPVGVSVATKGQAIVLTASVGQAGKITYFADGKKIPKCSNLNVFGSVSTCSWKPSVQRGVVITARLTPTSNSFTSQTGSIQVPVGRRTSTR